MRNHKQIKNIILNSNEFSMQFLKDQDLKFLREIANELGISAGEFQTIFESEPFYKNMYECTVKNVFELTEELKKAIANNVLKLESVIGIDYYQHTVNCTEFIYIDREILEQIIFDKATNLKEEHVKKQLRKQKLSASEPGVYTDQSGKKFKLVPIEE